MRPFQLVVVIIGGAMLCSTSPSAGQDTPNSPGQVPVFGLHEAFFPAEEDHENPFDSRCVALDAEISTPSGEIHRLPLFYDGDRGWGLRYTPATPGRYAVRVQIRRKGAPPEPFAGDEFVATDERAGRGFVRVSQENPRYFVHDDGAPYFPLGENMGWVKKHQWPTYLRKLGGTGANWIRVWMCSWSLALEWSRKTNPDIYHDLDAYSLDNARLLDEVLQGAQENGLYVQLVFMNHGLFSASHNAEWDKNPYNRANGGFLDSAGQFFTNDECRRRFRDRLRYLVARYGWCTHLFAWEFWNEVDLTTDYDPAPVGAWHAEMARELKSLDPYNHPVTTSTSGARHHFYFEGMDFHQSHIYNPDVIGSSITRNRQRLEEFPDKPHFYGEMGTDWRGPSRKTDPTGISLHDMLWASIHSGASGTSMTWWWDNWVEPCDLYDRFQCAAAYVDGIDWIQENLTPIPATVEPRVENRTDLRIVGSIGWRKPAADRFEIDEYGGVSGQGECPSYLHGRYHRDIRSEPAFLFGAEEPGVFEIHVTRIAKAGAELVVTVNGEESARRTYPAGGEDYSPEEGVIRIEHSAGSQKIRLANAGTDWIQVREYRLSRAGQRLTAAALAGQDSALVWVKDQAYRWDDRDAYDTFADVAPATVALEGLADGLYDAQRWDTWAGTVSGDERVHAVGGTATLRLPAFRRDIAYRLRRVSK